MSQRSKRSGTRKKKKRFAPKRKTLRDGVDLQPNNGKGFLRSSSLRILLFVVLLMIALAAILYVLSPSVSVSSLAALNPSDTLSTPFTVLNDGYLTAHNVQARCSIIQAVDSNGHEVSGSLTADVKTETLGSLHAREHSESLCALAAALGTPKVVSASVTIEVAYRPDFYPWRVERRFGFITGTGTDGELHWLPRPPGTRLPKIISYDRY